MWWSVFGTLFRFSSKYSERLEFKIIILLCSKLSFSLRCKIRQMSPLPARLRSLWIVRQNHYGFQWNDGWNIRVKENEVKVNEVRLLFHRMFTLHRRNAEANQIEVLKLSGTLTALLTKALPDAARCPGLLGTSAVEMVPSVQEAVLTAWLMDLKFQRLTQQTHVFGTGGPGSVMTGGQEGVGRRGWWRKDSNQ